MINLMVTLARASSVVALLASASDALPVAALSAATADATCSLVSSAKDAFRMLTIATDPSCAQRGLGCVSSVCRYCRLKRDETYSNLLMCSAIPGFLSGGDVFDPSDVIDDGPAFTLQCMTAVSAGDAALGIDIVTDVSCTLGGVGCLSDLCRYCQVRNTTQSSNFLPCSSVDDNNGDDISFTTLPVITVDPSGVAIASTDRPTLDVIPISALTTAPPATTAAPTTAPPTTQPPITAPPTTTAPTTAAPLTPAPPTTTAPPVTSTDACAATVSFGDNNVGISAYTDATCRTGGLGCFGPTCRYCQVFDSPQSSYMLPCPSAPAPTTTTAAPVPTTATPVPTTTAPVPTTTAPVPTTMAPVPTTMAPVPTTPAPVPSTTTPVPTTAAPVPSTTAPVPTTMAPVPTTPAPVPSTTAPMPTTTAPVPTTTAPTPTPARDPCAVVVSPGDNAVGVFGVTDRTCQFGGLGCFSTRCRYCKRFDTPQSSYLYVCTSTPTPTTPVPTTAAPTTAAPTTAAPMTRDSCAASVASGDAQVGISAYMDAACHVGGLGCFNSSCRFCKVYDSPQSQQFLACP